MYAGEHARTHPDQPLFVMADRARLPNGHAADAVRGNAQRPDLYARLRHVIVEPFVGPTTSETVIGSWKPLSVSWPIVLVSHRGDTAARTRGVDQDLF